MARTKVQKKEIMEKVETLMDGAQSIVFANIHGLRIDEATAMRRKLKSEKVGFFVAKKSLTALALKKKDYVGTMPELVGEFGFAYGADLVAPARVVYEFQKKYKDHVSIIGGVFEGRYVTKDEMVSIASIPPLQTLYGMLANVINFPIQGLVIALDQISQKKTA